MLKVCENCKFINNDRKCNKTSEIVGLLCHCEKYETKEKREKDGENSQKV